jgi:hypothetical protein
LKVPIKQTSKDNVSLSGRGTGSGASNLRFMGQLRQYGSSANLKHSDIERIKIMEQLNIRPHDRDKAVLIKEDDRECPTVPD